MDKDRNICACCGNVFLDPEEESVCAPCLADVMGVTWDQNVPDGEAE